MTAIGRAVYFQTPHVESIPLIDCLALVILPLMMNLSAVPQIPMQRTIVLLFFGVLLFKNVVGYPACSRRFARAANDAFAEVFSRDNRALWILISLLLLFTLADARGGFLELNPILAFFSAFLRFFLLLFYLLSVVALNRSDRARRALIIAVVCGTGLFVAVNIGAYFAGMRGALEDVGQNKMLSLVGISTARASLPIAAGVNNFGAMAGLAVVAGFSLARHSRFIGCVVAVLGLSGVVLADSRASLVVAVVTCVAIIFIRRLVPFLRWLPIAVVVMPVLLYGANAAIKNTSAQTLIARDGFGQQLGPLTGRDLVWKSAIDVLAEPHPIHLIGYGASGQITSGATKGYSWIFAEPAWRSRHSLHNTALQIAIDIGYIGFALWLLLWWRFMASVVARWRDGGSAETSVLTSMAIFIAVGGVMEVSGTPSYPDVFTVLMLLVVWTLPRLGPDRQVFPTTSQRTGN